MKSIFQTNLNLWTVFNFLTLVCSKLILFISLKWEPEYGVIRMLNSISVIEFIHYFFWKPCLKSANISFNLIITSVLGSIVSFGALLCFPTASKNKSLLIAIQFYCSENKGAWVARRRSSNKTAGDLAINIEWQATARSWHWKDNWGWEGSFSRRRAASWR